MNGLITSSLLRHSSIKPKQQLTRNVFGGKLFTTCEDSCKVCKHIEQHIEQDIEKTPWKKSFALQSFSASGQVLWMGHFDSWQYPCATCQRGFRHAPNPWRWDTGHLSRKPRASSPWRIQRWTHLWIFMFYDKLCLLRYWFRDWNRCNVKSRISKATSALHLPTINWFKDSIYQLMKQHFLVERILHALPCHHSSLSWCQSHW